MIDKTISYYRIIATPKGTKLGEVPEGKNKLHSNKSVTNLFYTKQTFADKGVL